MHKQTLMADTPATCAACCQVAEELTAKDVIRAHARDELGIDIDDMANPTQAAVVSLVAFTIGAALPLLAGSFISEVRRLAFFCLLLHALSGGATPSLLIRGPCYCLLLPSLSGRRHLHYSRGGGRASLPLPLLVLPC